MKLPTPPKKLRCLLITGNAVFLSVCDFSYLIHPKKNSTAAASR